MIEQWEYIKGFKNYQVSTKGRVRNIVTGKILKPKNERGYCRVGIRNKRKRKFFFVHRLVAQTFLIKFKGKTQVNHIDGIKDNNRVENLQWVTSSENHNHAYNIGLKNGRKGMTHHNNKLTDADVMDIRYFYKDQNYTQQKIADKFGIHVMTVNDIIKRRTWTHI